MAGRKRTTIKTGKARRRTREETATARAPAMDFAALVRAIADAHERMSAQAVKAVNVSLTFRNWLIGRYIREYELGGSDRAAYGDRLFDALAERLNANAVSGCDRRQLYRYRDFYRVYPEIVEAVSPQSTRSLTARDGSTEKVGTLSPQSGLSATEIVSRLSYSHFEELTALDDPSKRAFYEIECVRGNWSVRELKRQIASLYFERSALSRNKTKLARLANAKAEPFVWAQVVRDPYVFEFLGLKPKEVVSESALV